MNKLISVTLFFCLALVFLSSAVPVQSADTSIKGDVDKQLKAAAGKSGANYQAPVDPRLTAMLIVRVILRTIGVVFVVLTIYAGFTWMTAGGNDEKVETSKKMLQRSVIGLIIVFSAYSITIFAFQIAVNYFKDPVGGGVYESPVITF